MKFGSLFVAYNVEWRITLEFREPFKWSFRIGWLSIYPASEKRSSVSKKIFVLQAALSWLAVEEKEEK